ncbi:MAG: ketopantoate reductase family protein [Alphaproteobacteria bacterium]
MKIAVMGTGGVGGYFGARLAASGEDVTFIARGAHLDAIRKHGLRIDSTATPCLIKPAKATSDPAEIGPVDVVLFAVKLWDTESAGAACKPLIGPDTAVISLQNGVDAEGVLSRVLGRQHVMGGVAGIFATISEPGVIKHVGAIQLMIFGALDGKRTARAEAFLAASKKAGIDAVLSENIDVELWKKFVYLTALSGMTCYTRSAIGRIRDNPEQFAMMRAALEEAIAVARAKGVALPPDVLEERLSVAKHLAPEMRSSMLHDLERGSRLELPWLSGAVVRMGEQLGISTPVHRRIRDALARHA